MRNEEITKRKIGIFFGTGAALFFGNGILLYFSTTICYFLYVFLLITGYICLLTAGVWIGRLLSSGMMDDPFNNENESFMQETRLIENEYSVNLRTRFYYKKRWHDGFVSGIPNFFCTKS